MIGFHGYPYKYYMSGQMIETCVRFTVSWMFLATYEVVFKALNEADEV